MIAPLEPRSRPGLSAPRARGAALLLALMGAAAVAGGSIEAAGARAHGSVSALRPVSPQPSPPVG
jgi:hypothetical protein